MNFSTSLLGSRSSPWNVARAISRVHDYFRPSYTDGRPRPSYDDAWIRRREYAPEDVSTKDDVKVTLGLGFNNVENQIAHHTWRYMPDVTQLVVRRGQPFDLAVSIEGRAFNKDNDSIRLLFAAGERPLESKGTLANVAVYNNQSDCPKADDQWKAHIISSTNSVVQVRVTSPSDTIVSSYKVTVKVFLKTQNNEVKRHILDVKEEMYIIFNPWNKEDQVYMADEAERNEYVMSDTGRIYAGSLYGRPWNFGQFEKCCFEAAFYLLDKSYLSKRSHGNATLVSRALSSQANSCDYGSGVLTGNWSGTYTGGTSPSEWNGSVAILEEYMSTKRAVKYGQCWVFSGLLTTLCRTIGIPTRSVTNFSSAHDTDCSLTIDEHYNTDLEPIEHMNGDSAWNFHVWNEGWFRRPDLPEGYDGWQAFDATPQEESDSLMQCGPAPLAAIKQGNVYLGYDTKFIFAEVNGDKVVWLVDSKGDMKPLIDFCNPMSVGKTISTKAVGSRYRNDVTHLYKYAEGSNEERKAVEKASKFSSRKTDLTKLYDQGIKDVEFKYEGKCQPNGDVVVKFGAKNNSKTESRNIVFKIRTSAVYYTGNVGDHLSTKQEELSLDADKEQDMEWTLPASAYLNVISEDAKLKVYVTAKVLETDQFFVKNDSTLNIEKPDLELTVNKQRITVGERVELTIKFVNPVDVKLTKGIIRLEGPGIQRDHKIHLHRGIEPGQELLEKFTLTPRYPGKRELIASFNCRQLTGITGVLEMDIQE